MLPLKQGEGPTAGRKPLCNHSASSPLIQGALPPPPLLLFPPPTSCPTSDRCGEAKSPLHLCQFGVLLLRSRAGRAGSAAVQGMSKRTAFLETGSAKRDTSINPSKHQRKEPRPWSCSALLAPPPACLGVPDRTLHHITIDALGSNRLNPLQRTGQDWTAGRVSGRRLIRSPPDIPKPLSCSFRRDPATKDSRLTSEKSASPQRTSCFPNRKEKQSGCQAVVPKPSLLGPPPALQWLPLSDKDKTPEPKECKHPLRLTDERTDLRPSRAGSCRIKREKQPRTKLSSCLFSLPGELLVSLCPGISENSS